MIFHNKNLAPPVLVLMLHRYAKLTSAKDVPNVKKWSPIFVVLFTGLINKSLPI
jgi:hypothetical protein